MSAVVLTFKDLVVWQKGMALARIVYSLSAQFPKDELFGLTAQLRRAAVSVPSNIAEGHARRGAEFSHFLSMARGSLAEVETQLLLAVGLGYLNNSELQQATDLIQEIGRMLNVLGKRVSHRPKPRNPEPYPLNPGP